MEFQPWTLTTPDLGSFTYCYVAYLLELPHPLLLTSNVPSLPPLYFSFHHRIIRPPGFPSSPSKHNQNPVSPLLSPSLPNTDSSSPPSLPPHLSDSRRHRYLAATEIFFNVPPSCCYTPSCRNHGSRNFPSPAYLVSFAQISNIGRRSTHSVTVACLSLIYSLSGLVPTA